MTGQMYFGEKALFHNGIFFLTPVLSIGIKKYIVQQSAITG
jgi:hypothetical protein